MSPVTLSVALTCFNRRDKTLACVAAIDAQVRASSAVSACHIVVTDDGSTDGTAEALAARFPEVEVLRGDGELFWAGGMRQAYGRALAKRSDYCLWLNDDVVLFPDCLERLLGAAQELRARSGRSGVVVGSTCDDQGEFTYGGMLRGGSRWRRRYPQIRPGDGLEPCATFNGNCVLIPREASDLVGNIDTVFRHGIGDMDYGLRLTAAGVPIAVMPGFAGRCSHDHLVQGSYLDHSLPLAERWRKITGPKGLTPPAWFTYCKRHAGLAWPLAFLWPYTKVVLTWARFQIGGPGR